MAGIVETFVDTVRSSAVGGKRKKLQNDHVYAACLILEDYLDTVKNLKPVT